MHAVDQHDRLACPVGERAHDVARQLAPQEGGRTLRPTRRGPAPGRLISVRNR